MAGTFIFLPPSGSGSGSGGALQVVNMTTAERDALTPSEGMIIYNTDDHRFQGYFDAAWANLHGWGF